MVLSVCIRLRVAAVCFILLFVSTVAGQSVQITNDRPLHLLVLGDSILWGQGLKPEHKSWHLVKIWLANNTGRRVIERIEAHSGAVIEQASLTDNLTSNNREVNVGRPTIHEQIDSAASFYGDTSRVELVMLSGCGNDVGVQNLLNAENVGVVDDITEKKCGKPVDNLLRRVAVVFPSARIILTGYYPFFSEQTKNDFVLKGLARRFFKTQPAGAPRMTSKEVFERLKINSRQWHQASNLKLAEAAQKINAEAGRQRVTFAKFDFLPTYSFAAPETHLWGLNRSPFRTALLFLSFGKILLPSNDEVRKKRTTGCNEVYREQPNETENQKLDRKAARMFCRYAALGHPNKKGALLYASTIISILESAFIARGSVQQPQE